MVEVPEPQAGTRVLGVPTVADRVAQTAAAMVLGKAAEPVFRPAPTVIALVVARSMRSRPAGGGAGAGAG